MRVEPAGAPTPALLLGDVAIEPWVAATTTPATPTAPSALAAMMTPRVEGRGSRIRLTTSTPVGTFPLCRGRTRHGTCSYDVPTPVGVHRREGRVGLDSRGVDAQQGA